MNVEVYLDRLMEAAKRAGFESSVYGTIGEFDLPVLERDTDSDKPTVYVSAGVHGDEPAGPMAVLELLRRQSLPQDIQYQIFPVVNPGGLVAGTRENPEGVDLNRDYNDAPVSRETRMQMQCIGDRKFDIAICLHEDDEGTGFYIYSHRSSRIRVDYPGLALEAAKPWTGIDSREEIDEMPAKKGRMFPPESVIYKDRQDMPESLRLYFFNDCPNTLTTETPSSFPVTQRINAQCAVVETILKAFLDENNPK